MSSLFPFACLLLAVSAEVCCGGEDWEVRIHADPSGKSLPYRLLKPLNYDPKKAYPLVLFFHGAGERGTDNAAQLKNGVKVLALPAVRAKHPCFVIAPQCPTGQMWVNTPWSLDAHVQPERPTEWMRVALEIVEAVRKEFPVDSQRLYVAGLSMGGFGVWDAVARHPDLFAGAVAVCGGGDEQTAAKITKLPVWAFHGEKDSVVKTLRSRNMIAAIQKAGGTPKYTEYPGVGHDSWTKAFGDPATLEWLFAQKK